MKHLLSTTRGSVIATGLTLFVLVQAVVYFNYWQNTSSVHIIHAKEPQTTPTTSLSTSSVTPSERAEEEQVGVGSVREDVVGLIEKSFGRHARVALAIAKAESGLRDDVVTKSDRECSIGIYQINLADDYCNGNWVHADKVPGDTIEEKIEWLKVPKNNVKIAKQIYDKQGWRPWSVWLTGVYKVFL